jgi:nuclear pore complex protein Nup93
LTPRGALRYLVCIPRNSTDEVQGKNIKTRLYNKLSRLLLTTKAFESLAGHVSVDGSRMPSMGMGGLDKYFTRVEVSDILEFASEESYRDGNAADSAELLMLAERYGSLLSLICRQLSALVTEEHSDINQRTFWRTAAQHFYSIYLENGRSYVVQILEKEGRFSLKKTVFILLQLMDCFDSHLDRNWQRSWDVLNNLELFPRSASEMALKVSSYYELDGEVRDIFHSVILIAMDCLYQEYLTIKTSFAGESPVASTAQLRSSEIRSRAKLLVTFSCLIQYRDSNQTKLRINQMEACMV